MKLNFSVKQLGKKRAFIDHVHIEIPLPHNPLSLEALLTALVTQQVSAYNQRKAEKSLISFLSEKQVANQLNTGKVSFGDSYNDQDANLEKAIENVLQAFQDGLIAFFLNEDQIEDLQTPLTLDTSSHITIIRLTFLAGSFW